MVLPFWIQSAELKNLRCSEDVKSGITNHPPGNNLKRLAYGVIQTGSLSDKHLVSFPVVIAIIFELYQLYPVDYSF
jgi:hypothetical protein